MKILTFGWDFPPQTTGGLGVACKGLVSALGHDDAEVIFVLPKRQPVDNVCRFIFADITNIVGEFEHYGTIGPYSHSNSIVSRWWQYPYGTEALPVCLIEAVHAFAEKAAVIAVHEDFHLIHAHDWTTYLAGIAAHTVSGRPLIVHVHATAFDQAGGDKVDPNIYAIERRAFHVADCVIAVSERTKRCISEKYGVEPEKVEVVYNGIETDEPIRYEPTLSELKSMGKKIVLYHGRITIQKGVDYFVQAAKKVVEQDPNVVFVISGKGDMEQQIMHQVAALGLSSHVRFAGALWYEDRDRMYQSVDLVVMPSVSEPFGIVPLEAMRHGAPALISKQSGVAEVITHVLKVDFWDVDEMANKILAMVRYPAMSKQIRQYGKHELLRLTWRTAAKKVRAVYERLLQWSSRLLSDSR